MVQDPSSAGAVPEPAARNPAASSRRAAPPPAPQARNPSTAEQKQPRQQPVKQQQQQQQGSQQQPQPAQQLLPVQQEQRQRPAGLPPLPDIDGPDKHNPLAECQYVNDIYSYFRQAEPKYRAPANYMESQVRVPTAAAVGSVTERQPAGTIPPPCSAGAVPEPSARGVAQPPADVRPRHLCPRRASPAQQSRSSHGSSMRTQQPPAVAEAACVLTHVC